MGEMTGKRSGTPRSTHAASSHSDSPGQAHAGCLPAPRVFLKPLHVSPTAKPNAEI